MPVALSHLAGPHFFNAHKQKCLKPPSIYAPLVQCELAAEIRLTISPRSFIARGIKNHKYINVCDQRTQQDALRCNPLIANCHSVN